MFHLLDCHDSTFLRSIKTKNITKRKIRIISAILKHVFHVVDKIKDKHCM